MLRKPEWMSKKEWKLEKRRIAINIIQSVVSTLLLAAAIAALLK